MRTSQVATLLQMIDTFPPVALAHLVTHQPRHHGAHPLLADDGVLRRLEGLIIIVVDAFESRCDLGLLREESFGFGGRHGGGVLRLAQGQRCFTRSRIQRVEALQRLPGTNGALTSGVGARRCAVGFSSLSTNMDWRSSHDGLLARFSICPHVHAYVWEPVTAYNFIHWSLF